MEFRATYLEVVPRMWRKTPTSMNVKRRANQYMTVAKDMLNEAARDLRTLDKAEIQKRNKFALLREKVLRFNRKLNGLLIEAESL